MNWYIGQEIVAIEDHKDHFKAGDEFVILQLKKATCKCNKIVIDIGTKALSPYGTCTICKTSYPRNTDIAFHGEESFAPKQTMSEAESAIKELLEPIKVLK